LYDDPADADDVPKENGHIDLSNTLPAAFDSSTPILDTDDKVSGKVTLSGTAYDDQRITSIWMNIDDFTFTGSVGTYVVDPGGAAEKTYYNVATYADGSWDAVSLGDFAADGWRFNVTQVSIDQSGHNINWSLDWNTAKLGSIADVDIVTDILVRDRSAASFDNETKRVDVVPYISSISNDDYQGLSDDVFRSSTGKYSVDYHASNSINVYGFNLGSGTSLPDVRLSASPISIVTGSTGTTESFVTDTEITVDKNLTRSGFLTVFVNNIPSINNLTTDNIHDSQQEIDSSNIISSQWTDDRYLNVWTNTLLNGANFDNQTYHYPDMIMDGNQPIFMYSNDNNGRTYRTTSDTLTSRRVGTWYERQGSIARNSSGTYYLLSTEDAFSVDIGNLQVNRDQDQQASIGRRDSNTDAVYELISEDYSGRQLNRFRFPKLLVDGVDIDTQVYVVAYDSKADQKNIRFWSFQTMSATNDNLTEVAANGGISDRNMVVPINASEYYDVTKLGTLDSSTIVIAYYDEAAGSLKIAYSSNHTTSNALNASATWTIQTVDDSISTGSNVSITNDGTDVYLAYYDSANANLKFAKYDLSELTVTKNTVDAYLSVGTLTNIELINGVPYISYYSGSYNGTNKSIRIAYPLGAYTNGADPNTGAYSGTWEVMTVPSLSVPKGGMAQFNRTMIGTYSNNSQSLPVVGWLGDYLEYSKLLPTD
jgi:hypothetical protein